MHAAQETLVAIATARGQAALAIVRLSGPEAFSIVNACFRGRDLSVVDSHTAHVGYLHDANGDDIDHVVVTVFRAPRSATGENVVEITCHGGDFAPQLVLERLLAQGARMAAPGEFTQRAFLNGKLDLAQAESVAELIHASSSLAHRVSLAHLEGQYSQLLSQLRAELLELCAYIELELDFTEEDVVFADGHRLEALLVKSDGLIQQLLDSYQVGALVRDGVRVVIGGRPNAGKSTLLNALVGRDRAIVSETPGTTRDEIEAEMEIEGLRFRFVDTAGLRDTADLIEAEGVRRARHAIEMSDLLLYIFDLSKGLDGEEQRFLAKLRDEQPSLNVVLVGNKQDLVAGAATVEALGWPFIGLSATLARSEAAALRPLVRLLVETVATALSGAEASHVVTNQRHRQHLARSLEAVKAAHRALAEGASGEALALHLRLALHELGAITGEITNEDVLDQIFSRFCIGK